MSIKNELERSLGRNIYHVRRVTIDRHANYHGTAAVCINATIPRGDYTKELEVTYSKQNKMSDIAIAQDFAAKVDKVLRGTLEEL